MVSPESCAQLELFAVPKAENSLPAEGDSPAYLAPPASSPKSAGRSKRRLTAVDHHVQDALERFVPAHLQYLAERRGATIRSTAAKQKAEVEERLSARGLSWEALAVEGRHAVYVGNAERASEEFLNRLQTHHPGAKFQFSFIGREGRLQRVKGDFKLTIAEPQGAVDERSVSLKNYQNGPKRIQVCSGTFQSFALGFLLESDGIGQWRAPGGDRTMASSASGFRVWRDATLAGLGYGHLLTTLAAIDGLSDAMRKRFLDGDEFRFYNREAVKAIQVSVGQQGAALLHSLLQQLPPEVVRQRILHSTGFDGNEDLLVFGGNRIADSVTDPRFRTLIDRLRTAPLAVRQHDQSISLDFGDDAGTALSVRVPCTINTNGAWFRDGEPYPGHRLHRKEGVELAWGERRPKKSRELATSINTYLDLGATGLLRELPVRP